MFLKRRSIRLGCYLFAAFLTSFGALIALARWASASDSFPHKPVFGGEKHGRQRTGRRGAGAGSDSLRLAMGATWLASRSSESCEWSAYALMEFGALRRTAFAWHRSEGW
jgi:hypothetical protein